MKYKAKCPYCKKKYDRFTLIFDSMFRVCKCGENIEMKISSFVFAGMVTVIPFVLAGSLMIHEYLNPVIVTFKILKTS